MKLAIPVWNGRVSPVFDVARAIVLFEIDKGKVVRRFEESLPGTDLCSQALRIKDIGVDVLLCGAISQPMAALVASDCMVVPFLAGTVDDLLGAWLDGNLPNPAFTMPGCRVRMRQRHRRRCGGRGRRGWELNEWRPPNAQV